MICWRPKAIKRLWIFVLLLPELGSFFIISDYFMPNIPVPLSKQYSLPLIGIRNRNDLSLRCIPLVLLMIITKTAFIKQQLI